MYAATLRIELRIPLAHSLKEKRAVLRPILDGLSHRFHCSSAEVGHQNSWQLATVGVALVGSSASGVREVLQRAEAFVWSFPEIEVLDVEQRWLD